MCQPTSLAPESYSVPSIKDYSVFILTFWNITGVRISSSFHMIFLPTEPANTLQSFFGRFFNSVIDKTGKWIMCRDFCNFLPHLELESQVSWYPGPSTYIKFSRPPHPTLPFPVIAHAPKSPSLSSSIKCPFTQKTGVNNVEETVDSFIIKIWMTHRPSLTSFGCLILF